MANPARLSLVYALWCPHCDPISTERAPVLAKRLGIPLRLLDIDDPRTANEADRMVEQHGLWDPDYVIPQVFLEWDDGRVDPILVADRGSPLSVTRSMWEQILANPSRLVARPAR
ncbi:MAG TPA: hypothetical protein VGP88_05165 [Thermoplasmata archaeon]|jgi:glutaredoxin|nr:hypothetical protein [Thermoplasmata archaeon]